MTEIDASHAAALRSWVSSANGHADFPIQNLPLGVFSPGHDHRRAGIAIGDQILDLPAVLRENLLTGEALRAAEAAAMGPTLNGFLALGAQARRALRLELACLLSADSAVAEHAPAVLHDAADCTVHLPASVGDYTDFYAGIHHAVAIGSLFRPDAPLLPNYKHVPIGYHGRASSVRPSGVPFRRPNGQTKAPDAAGPSFGPTQRLDYELELGIWIGAGNVPGAPIAVGQAGDAIAGFCLLNDWSARDVQAWEYQPLGPFLAKNFCTTVSPWIITPEALAPFRVAQNARPQGDPTPLPYLWDDADQACGALDVVLEVFLLTARMREAGDVPLRLSRGNTRDAYWTVAQLVAHHSSNGCDLRAGDLFGSGTLSGPGADARGSLMELTANGTLPIALPNGEARRFLQDGDEIVLRARAEREGFVSVGFGDCRAVVLAAVAC